MHSQTTKEWFNIFCRARLFAVFQRVWREDWYQSHACELSRELDVQVTSLPWDNPHSQFVALAHEKRRRELCCTSNPFPISYTRRRTENQEGWTDVWLFNWLKNWISHFISTQLGEVIAMLGHWRNGFRTFDLIYTHARLERVCQWKSLHVCVNATNAKQTMYESK